MLVVPKSLRTALVLTAAIALGYTARTFQTGVRPVEAQTHGDTHADGSLSFQFNSEIGPASGLTIYNPTEHTLYVYQGITQGNSHVNCSFTLHIGHLGGPVDRQNCPIGNAF
jgi:hypothetical protein